MKHTPIPPVRARKTLDARCATYAACSAIVARIHGPRPAIVKAGQHILGTRDTRSPDRMLAAWDATMNSQTAAFAWDRRVRALVNAVAGERRVLV